MKLELQPLNCIFLLVPLLIWNIILGPKIAQEAVISDAHSPKWLLLMEGVTRMAVFILPLFIPLQLSERLGKIGFGVYLVGTMIYFASWIPLLLSPKSSWSTSAAGLLAPRLTPLLTFIGIALIGHSWVYAGLVFLFISAHTWHGVHNLKMEIKDFTIG